MLSESEKAYVHKALRVLAMLEELSEEQRATLIDDLEWEAPPNFPTHKRIGHQALIEVLREVSRE